MGTVRYDGSDWPLYRVSIPSVEMDDKEFAVLVCTLDGLFTRGERFAILLDIRHAPVLGAKRRQIIAERAKAMFERFPGKCVGVAVVLSTPLQRGLFTALHWFLGGTHAARAFETVIEAESWLVAELRPAGVMAREWQPTGGKHRSGRSKF
jgi:hypothetical protein